MTIANKLDIEIATQKRRIDLFINTLIRTGAVIAAIILFLVAGPRVEGMYFPVIDDVRVAEHQYPNQREDTVSLNVIGHKRRDCQFIDLVGLVGDGVQQRKATIIFEDSGTGISRPTGKQSFGIWSFRPKGDVVRVVALHDCGLPWATRTYLFTWERNAVPTP